MNVIPRAIAIASALGVLLIVSPAAADPSPSPVAPPHGWSRAANMEPNMARNAGAETHFGREHNEARVQAWVSPGVGALYLTTFDGEQAVSDAVAAARAELDAARAILHLGTTDTAAEELEYHERVHDAVAEADIHRRHRANETETFVRVLFAVGTDGSPHLLRGECVLAADAPAADERACRAALEQLVMPGHAADRKPLGALPPSRPPVKPPSDRLSLEDPAHELGATPAPAAHIGPAGDGAQRVLYSAPPEPADSGHRWLFLAGGIVLAAGIYLTATSRRRAQAISNEESEAGAEAPAELDPDDSEHSDDHL